VIIAMAKVDKKIGKSVQGDIPLAERPYRSLGEEIGLDEKTVIETVQRLLKEGTIRKFGAILRHQRAGYRRNAMVIWAVPDGETDRAGRIFSSFKEVTHCYERMPALEGRYNLFTMVHFRDQDMEWGTKKLALAAGIKDYRVLESLEEFKKTSMGYF
jgi:DNA-binding Lrp family transcriptional regulator